MKVQKQCRIILSLLMGLILLVFCLPVCAFAETSELSDGDEKGISLSTTVPPSIISGAGAVYEKCGTDGLMFKTDDAKDNLLRVLIDGNVVSPENYTVSGEPLTVTLHAGYLDTLSVGEHTIEIVTVNGTARARFKVSKKNQQKSQEQSQDHTQDQLQGKSQEQSRLSPATGDNSHMGFWLCTMCLSGVLLIALMITDKKRKAKK